MSSIYTSASVLLDFAIGQQTLSNSFANIHFATPGNDLGGGFFFIPSDSLTQPVTITLGGQSRTCGQQVKGLYYANARGQRLWPLDQGTLDALISVSGAYSNVTVTGGLYTSCTGSNVTGDLYSIYGSIKHTRGGNDYYIIAGTKYDWNANSYTPNFAASFQYFDNKTPLGFIFDTMGAGVWFVWGKLSTGTYPKIVTDINANKVINQLFVYAQGETGIIASGNWYNEQIQGTTPFAGLDTAWGGLKVLGTVALGQALRDRAAVIGNTDSRNSTFSAPNINISTLINTANAKATQLCRGVTSTNINDAGPVLCFSNMDVTIDLSNTTQYNGKTIIIQNGDAILQNSMVAGSPSLDLFVNKGNVYLANSVSNLQQIDGQGNIVPVGVTQGRVIKGVVIANWLLVAGDGTTPAAVQNKLYFNGKISTLNMPVEPVQGRIDQITNLLGASFVNWINLQNVFTWQCNPISAVGTDGVSCGNASDQYANIPFIVRDEQITSRLLQ